MTAEQIATLGETCPDCYWERHETWQKCRFPRPYLLNVVTVTRLEDA